MKSMLALLLSLCVLLGSMPVLAEGPENTGEGMNASQPATVEATVTDEDDDGKKEVAVEVTGDVNSEGKTGISVVVDTVDSNVMPVQVSIGGE